MSRLDWEEEVRPVLAAVYRALDRTGTAHPNVTMELIAEELERDPEDKDERNRLDLLLTHLRDSGYVDGERAMQGNWHLVTLQGRGLVEVAGWPARPGEDYGSKLLDLVETRLREAEDPEERGRLERIRETLTNVGTGIMTGLLTDLARRGI